MREVGRGGDLNGVRSERNSQGVGQESLSIEVVPHGVDECFKPLSAEDQAKARCIELIFRGLPGGETPPGEDVRTMKGTPRGDTRPRGGERVGRAFKSWDWLAERLFELLVGAERSDIAERSDVPVGGSPTGTGGSPVLPREVRAKAQS